MIDQAAPSSSRTIIAVIIVAALAIVAIVAWDRLGTSDDTTPTVASGDTASPAIGAASTTDTTATTETGSTEAPATTPPETTTPSFDVVNISPEGAAVIAGRATPGAEVTVRDGDVVIGTVTADARGEWVMVPETAVAPGTRELVLSQQTTDGETVQADAVVVLNVPEGAVSAQAPAATEQSSGTLAVLVPLESGVSRVLQAPETGGGIEVTGGLSLDTVDYDQTGNFAVAGRGTKDGEVLVYMDNRLIGRSAVSAESGWRVAPDGTVLPGLHKLRVDQVDESGKIVARIETPFSRAETEPLEPGAGVVVVQPANSLWRIARRIYGGGMQYVVIYEANRDQIRDADLIYPGQIFVTPVEN